MRRELWQFPKGETGLEGILKNIASVGATLSPTLNKTCSSVFTFAKLLKLGLGLGPRGAESYNTWLKKLDYKQIPQER